MAGFKMANDDQMDKTDTEGSYAASTRNVCLDSRRPARPQCQRVEGGQPWGAAFVAAARCRH